MKSKDSTIQIALVGDIILDDDDPGRYFDLSRAALRRADVVVGQVEVPHSLRGQESSFDIPAPPSDPCRLQALGEANFHVATLAGNHIFDLGREGIEDTLQALRAQNIQTTGAGFNLTDACRPAIIERNGIRVGTLSYNCVGPRDSKASPRKPGAAFLDVITHYEVQAATPGGPPGRTFSFPDPDQLEQIQQQIANLRAEVDFVVVALHKGIGHLPVVLAQYERLVAKAAIQAGAQLIVGHHAHICRGVEVIQGCPVYHGLGNFVTVTGALSTDQSNPERKAWAKKRKQMFGFEPDPRFPLYPFHPESRNSLIAVCDIDKQGIARAGFLPCWINEDSQPEVHGHDEVGERVAAYMRYITHEAGLMANLEWDGDQITFIRR